MKRALFSARALALGSVLLGIAAGPAHAATATAPSTANCTAPAESQMFLPWGDSGEYTYLPGESADSFTGAGWTLSGGASVQTTRLADGTTGTVLSMPSGSKALSPYVCVGAGMPLAKTLIRYGAGNSGTVAFTPTDLTAGSTKGTMQLLSSAAWALTPPVNVLPGAITGWHIMQFTYVAGGTGSTFQISNFGVDPRMRY